MTSYDCTDISVLLSGLIDDELDAETKHRVERHVATCTACRDRVSEAETVNLMLRAETELKTGQERLSDEFIGRVLSRTVYAESRGSVRASLWTNWIGWLAAAACLMLAVTIWVMDRVPERRGIAHPNTAQIDETMSLPIVSANLLRSTVRQEPSRTSGQSAPTTDGRAEHSADSLAPNSTAPTVYPQSIVQTLDATALLMHFLVDANVQMIEDIERIREIAMYDELPQRLARARDQLDVMDRAAVFAAESVLFRIINGPLSREDLEELQSTVQESDIAGQLEMLGSREPASIPI